MQDNETSASQNFWAERLCELPIPSLMCTARCTQKFKHRRLFAGAPSTSSSRLSPLSFIMSEFTFETLGPAKSAWSKASQTSAASAPSPRSQSLSLTTSASGQSQPHLTPSRRLSALGGAVSIEDYASIPMPRDNIGDAAPKQGVYHPSQTSYACSPRSSAVLAPP
jgi:hypothetical protein